MRLGIMQPYIFPYAGYWQLIHAVDQFVILDDVNFIKRGFINRNSILVNGKACRFSIPVKKASQNKLICECEVLFPKEEKQKFLKTITLAYKNAPVFTEVFPMLEQIVKCDITDLTDFALNSMIVLCDYLNIGTKFIKSSELVKRKDVIGQERIIEICKVLNADEYINPCGGKQLYSKLRFEEEGIHLYFLEPAMSDIVYKQFGNPFVPNLSIIDLLMFNTPDKINEFLQKFELV